MPIRDKVQVEVPLGESLFLRLSGVGPIATGEVSRLDIPSERFSTPISRIKVPGHVPLNLLRRIDTCMYLSRYIHSLEISKPA